EFTNFLIYTIGKDVIIDSQTIANQATATPAHYYGLACWFIVMLLWTLIFFHILYQDKSQRMKNRMRLYGVTQLQQIIAKAVVTFFITGILSVGSFMLLQKILTFELIGEDYMRIFTVGVLLHIIFLECLAILEQIIRSSKVRLLGQSVFTLGIILLSGAIIPTLYFPMVIQRGLTYLFSYQAFYWFQGVLLQQRFYVDDIPLIGISIVGLFVLIAISFWKERILYMINTFITRLIQMKHQWLRLVLWLLLPLFLTWIVMSMIDQLQSESEVPVGIVLEEKTPLALEL